MNKNFLPISNNQIESDMSGKSIIFGKLMEGFISRQNNKTENKE